MPNMEPAPIRGPWTAVEAQEFLDATVIPIRLGVQTSAGWPLVMSVWFIADGLELLCATQSTSTLVRCLEQQPVCGFEVAADTPPYRGVRGHAEVEIDRVGGAVALDRLLLRYLGSLESPLARRLRAQASNEVCLRLRPISMVSWDFSRRMASSLSPMAEG